MKQKARFFRIDILRTTGILLMIIIHVLSWHFGETGTYTLWNRLHFVVPILVFCSSYLYAKSRPEKHISFSYREMIKRVTRLYLPYFAYMIVHYSVWTVFPTLLHGYGLHASVGYVLSSVFLTGGIDIGWLTLIFIQLAILSPFLLSAMRSNTFRLPLAAGSIALSLAFVFYRIPAEYSRLTAWITWPLLSLFAMRYADLESDEKDARKFLLVCGSLGAIVSYALYLFISANSGQLAFTGHKYPPDLYYLSYGIAITSMLLLVSPVIETALTPLRRIITFISRQSYAIFFIHMIVLDAVMVSFRSTWIFESVLIIFASAALAWMLTQINIPIAVLKALSSRRK